MKTANHDRRLYQVLPKRYLFFSDPSAPGVDKIGNVWGRPGEYVDAGHPVLRAKMRGQLHKVRALKPGDTVPKGSIFHEEVANMIVAAEIRKYDGKAPKGARKTAAEIVVGEATEKPSGDTPKLASDPVKAAKAKSKSTGSGGS